VSDACFAKFQRLVEAESGIYLPPSKKPLLVGRLAGRLRQLGLSGMAEYYRYVKADPSECTRMIDCISTNETQFFREPVHFDFLTSHVFPQWWTQANAGKRPRSVRAWSAGCSTGEEPYSLAMVLLDHFPPISDWQVDILATDISTRVLDRAQAGVWPLEKSRRIPPEYLKSYMLRGVHECQGSMKAGREISRVVRFEHGNLLRDGWHTYPQRFDLIFCRNVLIYFQPEGKARVVNSLINRLAPDGFLFVGHSESLHDLTGRVRSVIPTVYTLASES
jgi:chemotaxis protein methyltransferase CheR